LLQVPQLKQPDFVMPLITICLTLFCVAIKIPQIE
jgi:hypothetical protein